MKNFKSEIFKAYDVRGIYPKEFNAQIAYLVGEAFVEFLKKTERKRRLRIVIGRDNRLSSPILKRALIKGILVKGGEVIDIGLSTTPMFYFAVWNYHFEGGIQITASHNPPEYNGLKLVGKDAAVIGRDTGLENVKQLVKEIANQKHKSQSFLKIKPKKKDVLNPYLNAAFKNVSLKRIKPLRIAIDTSNAVPGILMKGLKKYLPVKIYPLFSKLDGHFPSHDPNPLIEKNIQGLKNFVLAKHLDLGAAFDGDGDRIMFVSEKGKTIPSDFITALTSKIILKQHPGVKILYNICSSNIIRDTIKQFKGIPIAWKIGHAFIKEKMKKDDIFFAGEFSGHYYLKANKFCESPVFVLGKVLEAISEKGQTISQIIQPFQKYFNSGQLNFKIQNKSAKMRILEKKFSQGKISHLDGLRVDFLNWWFHIRPSNTENLLRLIVEAKEKPLEQKKLSAIEKILGEKPE